MSQMRLITDSRDEWTVKELVETLHAKVDDLERKLDAQLKRNETISWQLHAIILHLTGDRAALTDFVMASEPTVVPNEDEAMPVLAFCPCCEHKEATTAEQVAELFGYRTMADGKTIVQSWCRECRGLEQATSPRKKKPLPDHIRVLGQQFRDLHELADGKAEERVMVLAASKGRETKESVALLVDEQSLRTEARKLQQQYDKERRPFSSPRKPKAAK